MKNTANKIVTEMIEVTEDLMDDERNESLVTELLIALDYLDDIDGVDVESLSVETEARRREFLRTHA